MKVAFVLKNFGVGKWCGIHTVVREYAKNLQQKKHFACCWVSHKKSNSSLSIVDGIPTQKINPFKNNLGIKDQIDLVHFHHQQKMVLDIIHFCKNNKIPYVMTLHSLLKPLKKDLKHPLVRAYVAVKLRFTVAHYLIKNTETLICLNYDTLDKIQKYYPEVQTVYMYNGVDIDRFKKGNGSQFKNLYGIPEDKKMILYVARIRPQKDQLNAVRIFKLLHNTQPNTHFVMIGCINYKAYYKKVLKEIQNLGLMDSVTIVHNIDFESEQLCNAYHACDTFFMSSQGEESVLSVLEAWAAKKPVVVCLQNRSECIENGVNAFSYEAKNHQQAVELLAEAISNSALSKKIAHNGYELVRTKYNWSIVTETLLEIYQSTLQNYKRNNSC